MSTAAKPLPGTTCHPCYPDSDGQPMGETGLHVVAIFHLFEALSNYFRNRADVYVAAEMFLHYEEGNPAACKAPDVMVAMGVAGNHLRRSFRDWVEGVVPAVIFEITSTKTRYEDDVVKPQVYAGLGVAEYFVFDPEDESEAALIGFRLQGAACEAMARDADGRLSSHELGLALEAESPMVRLIDVRSGRRLLTYSEKAEQLEEMQREAQDAQREAKDAQRVAEDAQHMAAAERARAADLENELARLRAALGRPQSSL